MTAGRLGSTISLLFLFIAALGFGSDSLASSSASRLVVRASVGNLREKPTVKCKIIGKLTRGSIAIANFVQGQWIVVESENGVVGWAHKVLFSEPARKKSLEIELSKVRSTAPERRRVRGQVGYTSRVGGGRAVRGP